MIGTTPPHALGAERPEIGGRDPDRCRQGYDAHPGTSLLARHRAPPTKRARTWLPDPPVHGRGRVCQRVAAGRPPITEPRIANFNAPLDERLLQRVTNPLLTNQTVAKATHGPISVRHATAGCQRPPERPSCTAPLECRAACAVSNRSRSGTCHLSISRSCMALFCAYSSTPDRPVL